MSDVQARIENFKTMVQADPDNDMAHFSLGAAQLQAEQHADAAASLQRCIELNPEMSKAYELAGNALVKAGQNDDAAKLLTTGFEIAAGKGDLMPRDAMADLLRSIGHEPPALSAEVEQAAAAIAESGTFICKRSGRPGTQLPDPPMRGALGTWIYENISAETWQAWIAQGTKVINELRLDFSREQDQMTYDINMCEFLGIDAKQYAELTAGS